MNNQESRVSDKSMGETSQAGASEAELGLRAGRFELSRPGFGIAFSPNGKTMAAASGSGIVLWESTAPSGGYGPRRTGVAARKVVDELYEEHSFYSEVLDKLKADKVLDEPVRKVALQIANSRLWEDGEKLKKQSSESGDPEEVKTQQKAESR